MIHQPLRVRLARVIVIAGTPVITLGNNAESDPIAKISRVLPKTWKVQLLSRDRNCTIRIETNSMDTVPSHYSDGEGERKVPIWIEFEVLPGIPPKC